MKCLVRLPSASSFLRPSLLLSSKRRKQSVLCFRAKLSIEYDDSGYDDDPLYHSALTFSALRYSETHRPEPLFADPYVGCFVQPNMLVEFKHQTHHHCIATKFIDDQLLSATNNIEGMKQVVLLTDGLDTRPFRLKWPASTMLVDISPGRIFQRAAQKLEAVGAKVPRSCLFFHIPMESSDLQRVLLSKGFTGNRPSIWAIQGLPLLRLANFKDILSMIDSLAMKDCPFFGELPVSLAETEDGIKKTTTERWTEKLFRSNGFRVKSIEYDQVASKLSKETVSGSYNKILFVAEHLRFSDAQMDSWRRELQRAEDEGDEDGFEEW